MNINKSEFTDKLLSKTIQQPKNYLLKFLVITFMGTSLLWMVGYFIFRETKLNADRQLIQNCTEKTSCQGTVSALERLAKARKSLRLSNLEDVNLEDADLEDANLRSSNLEGANLEDANLEGANLKSANLAITQIDRAHLENAHLEGVHLSHAHLDNSYLIRANLENAYLSSTRFDQTYFNRANLRGAHFYRADFHHAYFYRADLSDSFFYRANFERTNFYGANLNGAYLIEANNITPIQIKSACHWEQAIYKGAWDVEQFRWVTDRAANQQFIQQLKEDRASDPPNPVDCSLWQ